MAMDQLESVQAEHSMMADTPVGELRNQLQHLSSTVESLTKLTKELEEQKSSAEGKAKELVDEKARLMCAPNPVPPGTR
jgi:peptidoglycan hydrolase CwlO-like protein